MATKKNKSEFIKKFIDDFKSMTGKERLVGKGYILIAYDKDKDGTMQNAYCGAGSPADLAECLSGCVKQDQNLANIVLAAGTSYMSAKTIEFERMKAESNKPKN